MLSCAAGRWPTPAGARERLAPKRSSTRCTAPAHLAAHALVPVVGMAASAAAASLKRAAPACAPVRAGVLRAGKRACAVGEAACLQPPSNGTHALCGAQPARPLSRCTVEAR